VRRAGRLLALVALLALAGDAGAERARVVLLVLRGVSFENAARVVSRAVPLVPIDGAVTAAAMGTLFTGAVPARHGMVGNVFREGFAGDERDAFAEVMLAEPLWEAAERQGLRVAVLNLRLPGHRHAGVVATWTQGPEPAGPHDALPPDLARELDRVVGAPPGAADLNGLLSGRLSASAFADQVERWARHRRADVLHVMAHRPWDLLIVDENVVDAMLHPFTGREGGFVERALALAGETVKAVTNALPDGAMLVVASPYGMAPVNEAVSLAAVLDAAGLATGERRIAAYGPVAHVYLAPGVPPGRVETALRAARQPGSEAPLFERVETRGAATSLPLFHPDRAGDIVLLARPGAVLSAEPPPVTPRFPGDHGHAASAPGASGFLAVAAPDRTLRLPARWRDLDVAPTVACLLDIDPPRHADGRAHSLLVGVVCDPARRSGREVSTRAPAGLAIRASSNASRSEWWSTTWWP
jgi:hypothetical protein